VETPESLDRETPHAALVRFRARGWGDTAAVLQSGVTLGISDRIPEDPDDRRRCVTELQALFDRALERIRSAEANDPPQDGRSIFFAGALLLRRPALLSEEDEALLRKGAILKTGQSLDSLANAGIETLRQAIATKWRKLRRPENIGWLTFKQHHESTVYAALVAALAALESSSARSSGPARPDAPSAPATEATQADMPRGRGEMVEYCRRLRDHILALHFSRSPGGGRTLPLDEVFVSLPLPVAITALVADQRIAKWALTQVSGEAEDYRTARGEGFDRRWNLELEDVAGRLVPDIEQDIRAKLDGEYIDDVNQPCVLASLRADGVKWNLRPLRVEDAVMAHSRVLLLGRPGGGKSTVARHLALSLIRPHLSEAVGLAPVCRRWGDETSVPIYVSLRELVASSRAWDASRPAIELLWEHVVAELDLSKAIRQKVGALVAEGRAMVVLDGLDEIPRPSRAEDAASLEAALERFVLALEANVRFLLVTSRQAGAARWHLDPLVRYELAPLRGRELIQFATNLLEPRGTTPGASAQFLAALRDAPASLKDRPLFVHLMAAVFAESMAQDDGPPTLPSRRSVLYRRSIMLLLDRWTRPRQGGATLADRLRCTAEELYRRLTAVAYETQRTTGPDDDEIPLGVLLPQLLRLEGDPEIRQVLAYLSQEAGVLVSPAPETYQFAHRGFQEFLAACFLASADDGPARIRKHLEEDLQLWRETGLMLGEALIEEGRSASDLWDYIDCLLDGEIGHGPLWLAARLLHDETTESQRSGRRNRPIVSAMREAIMRALAAPMDLDLAHRADLGTTLELLGDSRPGIAIEASLPDIAWCEIPAGQATIGTPPAEAERILRQPWAKGWSLDRETPHVIRDLPAFCVGRHPVTVAQFRAFLDADDGYRRDDWWPEAGLASRCATPAEHAAAELARRGSEPCSYVSWFDAVAFCRWASHRTGMQMRLPTEAEWERVARGPDAATFPWGDAFDTSRCNSELAGYGAVAAVGLLPEGCARWDSIGVHDMCGNVWEWTSTAWEATLDDPYAYPYVPDDGREALELDASARRVVRGGSYLNGPFICRAAYRGRDHPTARLGRQGFRVVADLA
jgi:formylglycine-generating enzyme required for sulfatase activity